MEDITVFPRIIRFNVELTDKASSRTKNRIRNAGPIFDKVTFRDPPTTRLAQALCGTGPVVLLQNDKWMGWVFQNEVVITPIQED